MRVAIYPGTFDPITNGHLDVIRRSLEIFDRLIVAIAVNEGKRPLFSVRERLQLIRAATKDLPRVSVGHFDGLLVEYARHKGAKAVVRGLRAVSDFEYEFQMALMNRKLSPDLEILFMMPSERYTYLNSTIVREIARLGGRVADFVPPVVERSLRAKFRSTRRS
jgi:pantetheine-phosphate adenylyltransferase